MKKQNRNSVCSCGSGKKHKNCCLPQQTWEDFSPAELEQEMARMKRALSRRTKELPIERISSKRTPDDTALLENYEYAYTLAHEFCQLLTNLFDGKIEFDNLDFEHSRNFCEEARIKLAKNFYHDGEHNLIGQIYETASLTVKDIMRAFFQTQQKAQAPDVFCDWKDSWIASKGAIRKINIVGSPQLGKTSVLAIVFHLIPVVAYVLSEKRVKYIPFLSLPSFLTLRKQSFDEFQAFKKIHGGLRIRYGQTNCSIDEYYKKIEDEGLFKTADAVINKTIIIRTPSSAKKCRAKMEELIALGWTPLPFTDESHYGSAIDGVQDRLLEYLHAMAEGFKDLCEITISATPDEQSAGNVRGDWLHIGMWIGPDYVGPSHHDGTRLPSLAGYKEVLPIHQTIDEFTASEGIYQAPISRKLYTNFKHFCKIMKPSYEEAFAEWDNYQKEVFPKTLIDICQKHFNWDAGLRSVTIRALRGNRETDTLIKRMEKHLDPHQSIVIIPFYGKQSSTIKEILHHYHKQGIFTIILVTANARMGCAFSATNNLYIDLTRKASTVVSVMQGMGMGRSCGYYKVINGNIPLILVSTEVKQQIDSLKENNFKYINEYFPRPGQRSEKPGFSRRMAKKNLFLSADLHPDLKKIGKAISRMWIVCGRPTCSNTKSADSVKFNKFIKNLLNNKFLAEAPQKYLTGPDKYRLLLLWGEEDSWEKGHILDASTELGQNKGGVGIRLPTPEDRWIDVCGGYRQYHMLGKSKSPEFPTTVKQIKKTAFFKNLKKFGFLSDKEAVAKVRDKFKEAKAKALENSTHQTAAHKAKGLIELQVVLRLADKKCPECDCKISARLYAMRRENKGRWNKAIKETCCWNNSEVIWEGPHLRCKKSLKKHVVPHYANENSRFRKDEEKKS